MERARLSLMRLKLCGTVDTTVFPVVSIMMVIILPSGKGADGHVDLIAPNEIRELPISRWPELIAGVQVHLAHAHARPAWLENWREAPV